MSGEGAIGFGLIEAVDLVVLLEFCDAKKVEDVVLGEKFLSG